MTGWNTLLFRCAICEREVRDYPDRFGPALQIEPICRYCEKTWTHKKGKPKAGAFMDRRNAMRISALADALHNGASLKKWEREHGHAS